jgi:hypothetical protein
MELITSIKSFFRPTSILKSSPIQILFIPFDINKLVCDCGNKYSLTPLLQKFCKNCLYEYIKHITNFDTYLDISNSKYSNTLNIEEQFEEWLKHLCFKQIVTNRLLYHHSCKCNLYNLYETCKSCGYNCCGIICSNCYLISFTWIKSTTTFPILHLPWWDAFNKCMICDQTLEFKSDCQKWCSNCLLVYIGCRYCLTTNIIFGITEQSQCMKCKRISSITSINIPSMKNIIEYFLKFNTHSFNQIANYVKNIDKHSNLLEIYSFIKRSNYFPYNNLHFYIENLRENNENYLNTIILIMFIPFNNNEHYCYCCKKEYSETLLFKQKYCKNCLFFCIKYATSNLNIKCAIDNLDVCISNTTTICDEHKPRNLNFCNQKWCKNCSEILYFKQIIVNQQVDLSMMDHFHEKKICKLCGKLVYIQDGQNNIAEFKLCSNCYSISFEFVESMLTKKYIPILHLPWWDAYDRCIICKHFLESISDSQKCCLNCSIIYIGCRYCLTTNIIFGFTNQSQCKKCKRIIVINAISVSGNYNVDEFLCFTKVKINNIADYVNNINNNNSNLLDIYKNNFASKQIISWIPYSQIINLEKIAEGGYGKIYKASINGNIVAVKEFINSQDPGKYFLNEVIFNSNFQKKNFLNNHKLLLIFLHFR